MFRAVANWRGFCNTLRFLRRIWLRDKGQGLKCLQIWWLVRDHWPPSCVFGFNRTLRPEIVRSYHLKHEQGHVVIVVPGWRIWMDAVTSRILLWPSENSGRVARVWCFVNGMSHSSRFCPWMCFASFVKVVFRVWHPSYRSIATPKLLQ